ncbi:hypothetical protein AM218_00585 [Hymenobacter sp. DG25A]|nr:hypothetical protein AM218_00585 [Hymenobacter sp. DG25A]
MVDRRYQATKIAPGASLGHTLGLLEKVNKRELAPALYSEEYSPLAKRCMLVAQLYSQCIISFIISYIFIKFEIKIKYIRIVELNLLAEFPGRAGWFMGKLMS